MIKNIPLPFHNNIKKDLVKTAIFFTQKGFAVNVKETRTII